MRRLTVGSLVIGILVALALIGLRMLPGGGDHTAEAVTGVADPVAGSIAQVGIDMEPASAPANPANGLLGSIETCKTVAVGGTITIDIFVDEVSPLDLTKGFQAQLLYTNVGAGAVKVTAVDSTSAATMLLANAGSSLLPLNDAIPVGGDTDGVYLAGATDIGSPAGTVSESGEGVLTKITLTGVTAGVGSLSIGAVATKVVGAIGALTNLEIPEIVDGTATVAVGQACPVSTDAKVSAVTTTSPAGGTVNSAFNVTANVTLHNNGGLAGVLVNTSITLSLPPDCTATTPLTVNVLGTALPVSVGVPLAVQTWSVTCTNPSSHSFTTTATTTINDPLAVESNPANNTLSSAASVTPITASADAKILSVVINGVDLDGLPGGPTVALPGGIVSDDAVDNDGDTLIDEDPVDGSNNDGDLLTDEDGGTVLPISVTKTVHNNGPNGPVSVALIGTGTGIVPTGFPGPAGAVAANCTLTASGLNPATVTNLQVSVSQTVNEVFFLHCGLSPFQNKNDDLGPPTGVLNGGAADEDPIGGTGVDNDGDTLIDEDSCDLLDNDGDTLINEDPLNGDNDCDGAIDDDPSFEVAAFAIANTVSTAAINPHVIDPVANNTNFTSGGLPAFLPDNPTGFWKIDEGQVPSDPGNIFPGLSGTPPLDGDCLLASACEQENRGTQPKGNALHGQITTVPNPDGLPGGTGFDIANGFSLTNGVGPGPAGSLAARVSFSVTISLGSGCTVPVGGTVALFDGALPGTGSNFLSVLPAEGPTTLGAAALVNPAVWPKALESDLLAFNVSRAGGLGPVGTVPIWARYTGYEPATGNPVNVLVYNAGAAGYSHVAVLGNPTAPSSTIACTPFQTDTDYLGETVNQVYNPAGSEDGAAPGTCSNSIDDGPDSSPAANPAFANLKTDGGDQDCYSAGSTVTLRECQNIGNQIFANTFINSQNGVKTTVPTVQTCSAENDISVTKTDDQTIGNDLPPGDRVHVGIPTTRTVNVTVTNGPVPADIDVSLSATFTGTTSPPQCSVRWVAPALGSQATVGNQSISTLTFREFNFTPGEVRPLTVDYQITCSSPVNLANALQIVVNVNSFRLGTNQALPDPNINNNQAQNKVTVISLADYDGDGVPTPQDNCPNTPNPSQTDTDGDGLGDACDPDDDGDGVLDGVDGCPLLAEDPDGVADTDGCPDTDVGVSVVKDETYTVDTSTTVTKTVNITVTNGNYPANVLVHVLGVSTIGQCEVHFLPQAGDTLTEFTTDETPPVGDDTLWSQLERTEAGMAAGEVRNLTRSYTVHCLQRSQHSFEIQVDAVPLPPVREENVENAANVVKNHPTVTSLDKADLKKTAFSVTSAPTSAQANVPFNLVVTTTIHNNGPAGPVSATDNVALTGLPGDCLSVPNSDLQVISNMPVSVPVTFQSTFSVTCTTPSNHTFNFTDTLTLTGPLHVVDPNSANNTATTSASVPVLGNADLKVTGVVITAPASVNVSTNYPVTVTATVHNNGPQPVTSATVTINASVAPDCTLVPNNLVQNVALPVSVATPVVLNAVLHCSQPSNHTINASASASFNQLHVTDPDQANNSANATAANFTSLANADLKISSSVAQDDLPTAGTQIIVGPLTPVGSVNIALSETAHNNGPFGPATVSISRTAAGSDADGDTIADCSASVAPASASPTLSVSVAQNVNATVTANWDDVKKPPYSCNVTINQSIAGPGGHILDPVSTNNSDTVTVTLVRDTDGDGVVDNFDGIRDNCQDVPNPGQQDADGDGLGDACDPNPARDAGIVCDVLLGPAAVNLSDTNGRYGWVVCSVSNNDPHSQIVTVNVSLSTPPGTGCSQTDVQILPGLATFVLTGNESKVVVERVRIECHAPNTGAGVYQFSITKCITSEKVTSDDDGDTTSDEDPIDGIDNDGDSLIDEDPPEGADVNPANDCSTIGKPVVIEQP